MQENKSILESAGYKGNYLGTTVSITLKEVEGEYWYRIVVDDGVFEGFLKDGENCRSLDRDENFMKSWEKACEYIKEDFNRKTSEELFKRMKLGFMHEAEQI